MAWDGVRGLGLGACSWGRRGPSAGPRPASEDMCDGPRPGSVRGRVSSPSTMRPCLCRLLGRASVITSPPAAESARRLAADNPNSGAGSPGGSGAPSLAARQPPGPRPGASRVPGLRGSGGQSPAFLPGTVSRRLQDLPELRTRLHRCKGVWEPSWRQRLPARAPHVGQGVSLPARGPRGHRLGPPRPARSPSSGALHHL